MRFFLVSLFVTASLACAGGGAPSQVTAPPVAEGGVAAHDVAAEEALIRSVYASYATGRPTPIDEVADADLRAALDEGLLDADPFVDAQDFGPVEVEDIARIEPGRYRVRFVMWGNTKEVDWVFGPSGEVHDVQTGGHSLLQSLRDDVQ